jgi:hypothetical protein
MVYYDPTTSYAGGGMDRETGQNIPGALWQRLMDTFNWISGSTGDNGNAVTKNNVQQAQLTNEIMGFPAVVGHGSNLVTLALWWANVATGTTTFVDLITEGIAETYGRWAIKHVAAATGDGPKQILTYANQPRVKSGRKLSHLYAVYIVTAARSVTPVIRNSDATVSTGTVISTVGSWVLAAIENHTLAGTSVDVRWTMDGAGTFYVIPLGTCIGTKAFALPPRPERYVDGLSNNVYNADPAGATFFDVDLTSVTSPLATRAQIAINYVNTTTASARVHLRRNGDTTAAGGATQAASNPVAAQNGISNKWVALDDGQVFETQTGAAAGDAESLALSVAGYQEWA